jgi:hypothetical protein
MTVRVLQRATLVFLFWLAAMSARAGAATLSVEEFMQNKSKWDAYAKLSTPLTIEGRTNIPTPGKFLRLVKCDVVFRLLDPESFPKLVGTDLRVEVEGVLQQLKGPPRKVKGKFEPEYEFVVDRVKQMPSDQQTFNDRRQALAVSQSEGWFDLGHWALGRGKFYEDDKLKKLAEEAFRNAIRIDYDNLPKGDAAARFALAEKGNQYNMGPRFHAELIHEGYRLEWDTVRKSSDEDVRKFLARIERDLPGSREPLTMMPAGLEQRYRQKPDLVYRESDDPVRTKLHRLLHNDVTLHLIEIPANPDGSNGYEIAGQIEERIPEWFSRAAMHRDRELDFRFSKVANSTQQQVVALAEQFETRGKADKANQARALWLAERSKRVAKDDPEGMVYLADQYEELLADRPAAVRILLEAFEKLPDSTEVAAALGKRGYTFKDGKWLTESEVKVLPVDPVEAAMREGRVASGMTRQQVEGALGKPSTVTRIATSAGVSEVWVYREKGIARVTVQFERASGRRAAEPRVVASF